MDIVEIASKIQNKYNSVFKTIDDEYYQLSYQEAAKMMGIAYKETDPSASFGLIKTFVKEGFLTRIKIQPSTKNKYSNYLYSKHEIEEFMKTDRYKRMLDRSQKIRKTKEDRKRLEQGRADSFAERKQKASPATDDTVWWE